MKSLAERLNGLLAQSERLAAELGDADLRDEGNEGVKSLAERLNALLAQSERSTAKLGDADLRDQTLLPSPVVAPKALTTAAVAERSPIQLLASRPDEAKANRAVISLHRTRRGAAILFGFAGLAFIFCVQTALSTSQINVATREVLALPRATDPKSPEGALQRLAVVEPGDSTVIEDVQDNLPLARIGEAPATLKPGELPVTETHLLVSSLSALAMVQDDRSISSIKPLINETTPRAVAIEDKKSLGLRERGKSELAPLSDRTNATEGPPEPGKPTVMAMSTAAGERLGSEALARSQNPLIDFLSKPHRTAEWIKVFVEKFYLSGSALDEPQIRLIYSDPVEYFGAKKLNLQQVAREMDEYYRQWPQRRYHLIPGSIEINWKSADIADVTFKYHFEVSTPADETRSGEGRAQLTLDLAGRSARIIREEGEVLAGN
jgi:hypothetical protein